MYLSHISLWGLPRGTALKKSARKQVRAEVLNVLALWGQSVFGLDPTWGWHVGSVDGYDPAYGAMSSGLWDSPLAQKIRRGGQW